MGPRAGRTSFFDDTWMYRRKIPAAEWTWSAQRGRRVGRVCFLWATFLCTSKERCARAPKAGESSALLCFGFGFGNGNGNGNDQDQGQRPKAFTPLRGASYFSLLVQRKDNQKKAHPASAPTPLRDAGPLRRQDFSTEHPCPVEKRRTSLCVAPFGVLSASSVAAEWNPVDQKLKQQHKQKQKRPHPNPSPASQERGYGATAKAAATRLFSTQSLKVFCK